MWTLFYLQRNNPCHGLIILYLNCNHFMVSGIYVTARGTPCLRRLSRVNISQASLVLSQQQVLQPLKLKRCQPVSQSTLLHAHELAFHISLGNNKSAAKTSQKGGSRSRAQIGRLPVPPSAVRDEHAARRRDEQLRLLRGRKVVFRLLQP